MWRGQGGVGLYVQWSLPGPCVWTLFPGVWYCVRRVWNTSEVEST